MSSRVPGAPAFSNLQGHPGVNEGSLLQKSRDADTGQSPVAKAAMAAKSADGVFAT